MRSTLTSDVMAVLGQLLAERAGDDTPIRQVRPVAGGDINQVYQVVTGQGRYLVKHHPGAPPRFFASEARGLRLLAGAQAVRVPVVYAVSEYPALLVMEWVDPMTLGGALARQHRITGPAFGLGEPHYLATLVQPAGWFATWPACWRAYLSQQGLQAERRQLMPRDRARRLWLLLERLDQWLAEDAGGPALLHGDLWGGNWMVSAGGEPVLIDPAVFYGSREVDLAMTELFGGFPPAFYQAYQAAYPLPPGYEERRPLYQLYYLLAHLNLFGESYGPAVDRILAQYT
jgi:fructosamine-3-kinase